MTQTGPLLQQNNLSDLSNAQTALGNLVGVNTTSQVEFLSQTSSGPPSWSVVSGQYLCAPAVYAPATAATLTVTGTAYAAFGSGTATTNTFTAPPSGTAVVTVSFVAEVNASGNAMAFALASHGTTGPILGNDVIFTDISGTAATNYRPYTIPFVVGSLTAGSAYTLDLLGAVTNGGTVTINAAGVTGTAPTLTTHAGPVVMMVQAV